MSYALVVIESMHTTFLLGLSIVMASWVTPPVGSRFRNHFGSRDMPNIGLQRPQDVVDGHHEVHNLAIEAPSPITKGRQRVYDRNRHFHDNWVAKRY